MLNEIESRIKDKLEKFGTPLKDWDLQINYGIKTGFNEAFIISSEKREELVNKCPEAAEIIRPILRGRDILKHSARWANLYLIFIPWHFPYYKNLTIQGSSKEAELAFEQRYPAVYKHLLSYKDQLLNRNKAETGIRYEWYALQRWGANYWEEFEKPKIIYPEITKFINFYLDRHNYYTNNKCFIITGKHIEYLTAFLNSSLFKFCFLDNFPELLGGTRELRKIFFEKIPVLEVSDIQNEIFREKNLQIQTAKELGRPTQTIEMEIDEMIFELYELTSFERERVGFVVIN